MYKKFLSTLLMIVMLTSIIPVHAQADITVYLTISQYGEFVKDKNSKEMVLKEINLNEKSEYILDDAFRKAHEMYYVDGVDGYASSEGKWGFGIDKLWGDTSYNFGYQVNGGTESVYGVDHILENGDYIEAVIYKNPFTEGYAKFDSVLADAYTDEEVELTLLYVSGYEDSGNMIFSPCQDATIIVDGEETDYVTDENGRVCIAFKDEGEYVVSAKKETIIEDKREPAITAPVCVVEIIESPVIEENNSPIDIIHNIAQYYSECDLEEEGGNLPWIIADMAVYEELFPNSENVLTQAKKEEALEYIVDFAKVATTPGDISKSILAVRSLGYDAKNIYSRTYEKINLLERLIDLVDSNNDAVTNIYTLPYVIIALSQADDYGDNEQIQKLIASALASKAYWQDTEFGTDALTPMVLALAPYYETNDDVKKAIEEAVEIIEKNQREDGLIDGFEGYEPASTGLAICALSAVGIDSLEVIKGEKSLIDGLLSSVNDEKNGFPNAFATEQGFRGLLAWQLLLNNSGKIMYDFSDYPENELNVSGIEYCPVIFDITPKSATVTITGKEPFSENSFDLDAGTYTYSISASRYESQTGTIEISSEDVENHKLKTISLKLVKKSYSNNEESSTIPVIQVTPKEEDTSDDASKFTENTFADVSADDWYYPAVKYVYEKNLFGGTDLGFEPNLSMTRAMLVTVLYRLASPSEESGENKFSDISEDAWYKDSVQWAADNKIVNGISDTEFAPNSNITREQIAVIIYRFALHSGYDVSVGENTNILSYDDFNDISEYAISAMQYAVGIGVISGRTQSEIAPGENATRAEVATMLMRFAQAIK